MPGFLLFLRLARHRLESMSVYTAGPSFLSQGSPLVLLRSSSYKRLQISAASDARLDVLPEYKLHGPNQGFMGWLLILTVKTSVPQAVSLVSFFICPKEETGFMGRRNEIMDMSDVD